MGKPRSLRGVRHRNSCRSSRFPQFVSHLTKCGAFSSLFTDEEIQAIRNLTFHDVLIAVMGAEDADIQKNVFFWKDGKDLE